MIQKRKWVKDKMKNKYKMVTGMALLLCLSVGCSEKEPEETPIVIENIQDTGETAEEEKPKEETKEESHIVMPDEGEEHLSGNVRDLGDNSVIISKIFIEESEDGSGDIIYLPGEGDQNEELVTVNFTDDTEFHYWVIQSDGGDIDMRESSFSEIKKDIGLEMYGNYDGSVFIASKVIIEVYE